MQTTMREANDRGYECLLVEDATESYFPAFKQATLEMVARAGRHRRLDGAVRRPARLSLTGGSSGGLVPGRAGSD